MSKLPLGLLACLAVVCALVPSSSRAESAKAPLVSSEPSESEAVESQAVETATAAEIVETVISRYPNRRIKIRRQVIQDAEKNYSNHGSWSYWNDQGVKLATGEYQKGKRQGEWIRLYIDVQGDHFDTVHYRQFKLPMAGKATFKNDKLHGAWVITDANSRKVRSWQFKDGRLHGESVWWHPNGKKMQVEIYQDGQLHGTVREWRADGKPIRAVQYVHGRGVEPVNKTYPKGEKQVQGWRLKPQEVLRVTYNWWEGRMAVKVVARVGEEQKQGKWTHWYRDGGRQFEGGFVAGKPVGTHVWWHPNGQKRIEAEFVDGLEYGPSIWWHANGQKQIEGYYKAGVQHGPWTRWDAGGRVVATPTFDADVQDKPNDDSAVLPKTDSVQTARTSGGTTTR